MTDWILGDEDEEPVEESATDGGDPVFDDAQPAGDGGATGDEFAFDDGAGGGDGGAFDDFDVEEGGDADLGGGGGGELEHRVDELEDELEGISSTVSTVRSENEQISESVEEVEENVRKLLDIYKLVTKGVNPFVDQDAGDSFSQEEASLGLFEGEEDEEPSEDDLDDEVAEADPDEFFDDDFEDEDADGDEGLDADESEEDPAADDAAEGEADADEEPSEGAKSFDELREEYESHPEWTAEDTDQEDEPVDADTERADDGDEANRLDDDPDLSSMDDRIDRVDEPMDQHVATALAAGPETEPVGGRPRRAGARGRVAGSREKPYLHEVPGGYVADLIVMEWVEFLVTVGGPDGAHRAITYYENVEWIVPGAADQLREFVEGHPETNAEPEDDGGDPLSMDHHTRSLRYIARLNGDVHENVLDAWDEGDNRWLHR